MSNLFTKFLFLLLLHNIICAGTERHLVDDLFDGLYNKEIYSGYLETDVNGTELFYIFTPSQSFPEKDPIVLWLNGGPGCSSTTGLFEEIGPVLFKDFEPIPVLNDYSWNKNANVFYIESPGGVGFSTLENPEFYYNDSIQAVSLNIAVQNFFKIFPEYQNRPFFIAGESYAGTYIPYLVREMFRYMDNNSSAIQLNLKGMLIGNPYVYEETDFEDSMVEFFFSHALISLDTYEKYLEECPHLPQIERVLRTYEEKEDHKFEPIINTEAPYPWKNVSAACNEARNETREQLLGINMYGIHKACPSPEETPTELKNIFGDSDNYEKYSEKNIYKAMMKKRINQKYRRHIYGERYSNENEDPQNISDYDYAVNYLPQCGETKYTPLFLNNETIKEKLGVDKNITHYSCFQYINYKWGDSYDFFTNDIKALYEKKNFTTWLFSGTEDIAVATLGTLRFLYNIKIPIKEEWKKWKVDDQVAGMEQSYDHGLRFITVKGVGHMVPEDNPRIAKFLFDKFLEFNRIEPQPQPQPTDTDPPQTDPQPTDTDPQPTDTDPPTTDPPTTDPQSTDSPKEDEGFPVWAIVLISVVGVAIIAVVVFILMRKRRKSPEQEIVENARKLKELTDSLK